MTPTPRQAQVLACREQGLSAKETALQLGIAVGTVKIHIKHLFEKGFAAPRQRPAIWNAIKLDELLARTEDSLAHGDTSQPMLEFWTNELRECKS
jgi:FixJ family two-component response regulator